MSRRSKVHNLPKVLKELTAQGLTAAQIAVRLNYTLQGIRSCAYNHNIRLLRTREPRGVISKAEIEASRKHEALPISSSMRRLAEFDPIIRRAMNHRMFGPPSQKEGEES